MPRKLTQKYRKELKEYIKLKKEKGSYKPKQRRLRNLPPNLGCPECECIDVKITNRYVTCVECGLKFNLDEYFDYCEKVIQELKENGELSC